MALAAILQLTGCLRLQEEQMLTETAGDGIVLRLLPGGLQVTTKATPDTSPTRPGDWDGNFNENKLGTEVDVFFYVNDATETTPSVYNNRYEINTNGLVRIPVSVDKLNTIFGGDFDGATAKVVVLANFRDENNQQIDHEQAYTLQQLMSMNVKKAQWNDFPQSSFIMVSCNTQNNDSPFCPVTITRPGEVTPASANIYMKRLAAKITFRITIADQIKVANVTRDAEGTILSRSLETWVPQMNATTAYLQYAVKTATLDGVPQAPPAIVPLSNIPDDHPTLMAYSQRNFYMTEDVMECTRKNITGLTNDDPPEVIYGEETTSDFNVYEVLMDGTQNTPGPFYTYPVKWSQGAAGEPFIKLIIPWSSGGRVKYYYYKVPFKESPLESNNWYVVTLDVQILGGEDQEPVPLEASYDVVSWEKGTLVDVQTTVASARYLSASATEFVMYNKDDLTIPITSSHDVQIVGYDVKPTASNGNDRAAGKAFTDGDKNLASSWIGTNPLIYNPFTETRYTIDDETVVGTIKATRPNYKNWDSGNPAPYTIDAASCFNSAEITRDQIIFRHTLINDLTHKTGNTPDYDVAPYYIRFRVQHKDDPTFFKDILIEQRPAIIIEPQLNSDGTNDQYHGYVYIDNISNPDATDDWKKNSTLNGENNANPNMYVITTGVLASNTDIIGDPRTTTAYSDNTLKNLTNNNTNWTSTQAAFVDETNNHRLSNYYPADPSTDYENIIAPSFRVASSYGKSKPMSYFDAQRRCASYQEDGYPAGRWRLPTKAEVLFITRLSSDGMIPELFTFTAGISRDASYWCASGVIDGVYGVPTYYEGITNVPGGKTKNYWGNETDNTALENKRWIRCVYDEWFWSDTQYDRVNKSSFTWGDQLRTAVEKNEQ